MSAAQGGTGAPSARTAAILLSAFLLALAGCTATAEPVITTTPTTQPPPPEEPEGDGPFAVVTIAAVDVDGLNVTVAGFVTEIGESGGSCVFEMTSAVDGASVTAVTSGEDNSTSTSCGSVQIPVDQLARGPWDVVLHYSSPTVTADSAAERVEVP